MKIGAVVGLIFSLVGILAGAYFAIVPVHSALSTAQISGQQAGVYMATIATILGLSCAAVGFVLNRAANNT